MLPHSLAVAGLLGTQPLLLPADVPGPLPEPPHPARVMTAAANAAMQKSLKLPLAFI
jgi:hypothetical protein